MATRSASKGRGVGITFAAAIAGSPSGLLVRLLSREIPGSLPFIFTADVISRCQFHVLTYISTRLPTGVSADHGAWTTLLWRTIPYLLVIGLVWRSLPAEHRASGWAQFDRHALVWIVIDNTHLPMDGNSHPHHHHLDQHHPRCPPAPTSCQSIVRAACSGLDHDTIITFIHHLHYHPPRCRDPRWRRHSWRRNPSRWW